MRAFLPIKSHSERVPYKNFRPLRGVPLYRWILSSILACGLIEEVCIDTDSLDPDLWDLDKHPRIIVKKRAPHLIGDDVSMNLLIEDYLKYFQHDVDIFMTHTTNPFLNPRTIDMIIERYYEAKTQNFDSLFSVTEFRARFYDSSLNPINHKLNELKRTQDLDSMFMENSCAYVFSRESFLNSNSRIGSRPEIIVTPLLESVDIDTPADWELATALAQSIESPPTIPSC